MLKFLYLLFSLLVIGFYGYAVSSGMEMTRAKKGFVQKQAGMRGAHGGARTFWYGSYRGGK